MKSQPSTWCLVMTVLLIILGALTLHVAENLSQGEAVEVPETKMMADWRELERLAREYPYQEQQGHGSR